MNTSNYNENAWDELLELFSHAKNQVKILKGDRELGKNTLNHLQLSTKSYLGSIALESGGLLIDHGWLRILGAGHEDISGFLISWNISIEDPLIIAYDLIGGFFALEATQGEVIYFAPDTLNWEDLGVSYSGFIDWVLNGDLDIFYQGCRWNDWIQDSREIKGNQAFSIYPYLWTVEGKDIENTSRSSVGVKELWEMQFEIRKQLNVDT